MRKNEISALVHAINQGYIRTPVSIKPPALWDREEWPSGVGRDLQETQLVVSVPMEEYSKNGQISLIRACQENPEGYGAKYFKIAKPKSGPVEEEGNYNFSVWYFTVQD